MWLLITLWLLCGCYAVTMVTVWLLCGYHVVTMWLLCGYYVHVVTMWLLCGCYVVTVVTMVTLFTRDYGFSTSVITILTYFSTTCYRVQQHYIFKSLNTTFLTMSCYNPVNNKYLSPSPQSWRT